MDITKVLEEIRTGVTGQAQKLDEMRGQVIKFDERLTQLESASKQRLVGTSLPGVNEGKDKGKWSFSRAVYAIATGDWSAAEFERDVFNETRKRALSAGSDAAGGYIVPTQYVAELIELLRANVVVAQMGAKLMPGLTGSPVEVPKQSSGATGSWVAEHGTISASDQAFAQIQMTPKQASALTKLSNRVLRLANPGIEAIVREDLAQVIARLIDLAALRGSGASNQPLGIANVPGINTVAIGANGGPVSYDVLADMEGELDDDDALRGSLGFVFHPKVRRKIAKLKDADGRPLFMYDPSVGQPSKTLLGYKWMTTTQLPVNLTKGSGVSLSEIYFANWAELLVGEWGDLMLDASREAGTAFADNQTWIRIIKEVDVAVRHAQSFCLVNDAETA